VAERSCTHLSESYAWILTSRDEVNLWLTAPTEEAMALQTPLASRALRIVARGKRQDGPDTRWGEVTNLERHSRERLDFTI